MTITETHTALWACLETALRQHCPVQVAYHGRQRIVCPHALGRNDHRLMLLAYQIGGQTTTAALDPDPRKRWRCMYIDHIDHVIADTTIPSQSADNYNRSQPFPAIDEVIIAI